MRALAGLRVLVAVVCVGAGLVLAVASGAVAAPLRICVPEAEGKPIKTPKKGVCAAKTVATVVLPQAEEEKLAAILPYEKYVASGVGGKPTIQVSGANVQILNGEGKTNNTNGAGNLVMGYDEEPGEQTGSHDLVLGTGQAYSSYSSLIGGTKNTAKGAFSVVFGESNLAEGLEAEVLGGGANKATSFQALVLGGSENSASGIASNITGGQENKAEAQWTAVSGGQGNTASVLGASVSGGAEGTASGAWAWVGGGVGNTASGIAASVFGGLELTAKYAYEAIP